MRKFVIMAVISAQALLLSGCAAMWKNVAYSDDLYSVHNKIAIAERQKAEAELAKAQYEAQQAQYEAQRAQYEASLAQANALAAQQGIIVGDESTLNGYDAVLADNYESAYARRLYGFSSPTYNMPSSYYTWRYSDAFHYASAYDPAFYNIVVSGDMVWVEPKYVTSMFGSWGATVIPSYGWYYSWNDPYYYWSSSYRWNWYNSWYSPYYWGWGCNSPYSYHYYHHHHNHHSHYPHHSHRPSYGRPSHNGRPPQHDNRPPQAGSGSVGNTGHHQINRPGTIVDRNPGTSRPADRVTTGSPRPSMPSAPSTPSTGRVSQPVNRVDGTASGGYTSGNSSYRSGTNINTSNSSTSKSSITQKSPSYSGSSSSNAIKKAPTSSKSSSSSSSSYRSSGSSSSSSSSSYRSSGSSSSRSYSSPSSSSSFSSGSRPSHSSGGNSRGR